MSSNAVGSRRDATLIADLLDEVGVNHTWIRLQLELIAANRSLVTKVVIGRLLAVQAAADDVQEAAGYLAALDPTVLYGGLEAWSERRNRRDRIAVRQSLRLHQGGRS